MSLHQDAFGDSDSDDDQLSPSASGGRKSVAESGDEAEALQRGQLANAGLDSTDEEDAGDSRPRGRANEVK